MSRVRMRALAAGVLLGLLLPLAPVASAGDFEAICLASACVWEMDHQAGDCPGSGMDLRETEISAYPTGSDGVFVFGFQYCYGAANTQAEGIRAGTTAAAVWWYTVDFGEGEECHFDVRGAAPMSMGCPNGMTPPNPGWGRILP